MSTEWREEMAIEMPTKSQGELSANKRIYSHIKVPKLENGDKTILEWLHEWPGESENHEFQRVESYLNLGHCTDISARVLSVRLVQLAKERDVSLTQFLTN